MNWFSFAKNSIDFQNMKEEEKYLKELLNERVKELKCLYEISKLCQDLASPMDTSLKKILEVIPEGWQYPDRLQVHLKIDTLQIGQIENKRDAVFIESDLKIQNVKRGWIKVAYLDVDQKLFSFLPEESQLLNQISLEISSYVERFEQREKEAKMEQVLRGNDRLNILSELTAGIAHELNTPLGNILGYAELLQKSEIDGLKRNDIQKIISSAKNAREIVKRLMYFSCEMPQQFSLSNINELIQENLGFLQKQILDNEIKINLKLNDSVPLIRLDALQFSQVLFNLILNAIDATQLGGTIELTTSVEENKVVMKIKDNGKGISEENRQLIFQPFFTTKPTGDGTGLGLSVVHGIIKGHGGEISVESELNKGTQFTITFPIN